MRVEGRRRSRIRPTPPRAGATNTARRTAVNPEDRVLVLGLEQELQVGSDVGGSLAQADGLLHVTHARPARHSQPLQRVGDRKVKRSPELFKKVAALGKRHAADARREVRAASPGRAPEEELPPAPAKLPAHSRSTSLRHSSRAAASPCREQDRRRRARRQPDAKVVARHVLKLMRLVEDHRAGLWENARFGCATGLLLDREICKKQVVVHDDQLALERAPPHRGDKASLPVRAGRAQARLGPGVQLVPQRRVLRQRINLRPVARVRRALPVRDRMELRDLV